MIALAACGGGGGAKVAAVAPAVAVAQPAPELRCLAAGHVVASFAPGGDDARAQAVASLCTRTGWPTAIVECVNTAADAEDATACLARLEPLQQEALTSLEQTWLPDDFDTVFGSGAGASALTADAPDGDADADAEATCASAIGDAARLPPVISLADRDRTWATALRAATLATACAEWSPESRACLAHAGSGDDVASCGIADLGKLVAASDALLKRLSAARARAGDITCARVAAQHYADAAWAGKLPADLPPAERRKAIADSRALMAKACDGESWSAELRACIVVGGGDACFAAGGVPGGTWGFPALGVFAATGIAACDAYTRAVAALLACSKLSASSKERLARSSQQTLTGLVALARDHRDDAAEQCQQANEEIEEMETNIGCAPP